MDMFRYSEFYILSVYILSSPVREVGRGEIQDFGRGGAWARILESGSWFYFVVDEKGLNLDSPFGFGFVVSNLDSSFGF